MSSEQSYLALSQEKMKTICFCIIAHIDHGKSTLADRFLELANVMERADNQVLDSMDLEKEKGITIKMHPVRLEYKGNVVYLIDTPGHIDFSYEISRALACCEGALLLVDAQKGIQAQTLFNLENAKKQGLKIIGAVNKVDAASRERVEETKQELISLLQDDDILEISGKTGLNVEKLFDSVVEKIPSSQKKEGNLQALIFDSKYDSFSGVISYVRLFSGKVKLGDKIFLAGKKVTASVKEVGYFHPELKKTNLLEAGQIGYIKTGIKEPSMVQVGDTITTEGAKALEGYREPQPVLYLSLYPHSSDDFEGLKDALNKLKLNDPALSFQVESKMALGRGFRVGFLGALHAEITIRRLGMDLVATSPQVIFEVVTKKETILISSPSLWPDPSLIIEAREPWVEIEIVTPNEYYNQVFKLIKDFSCVLKETISLSSKKSLLRAECPLREIIAGNFYDKLKSMTQGYASFSFKQIGLRKSDLVKVDILVSGNEEEAFSRVTHKDKVFSESKNLLKKLKKVLPKQQFSVILQAVISGKIIARETIGSMRKDVTGSLYGGDVTRKNKLLDIQKKGKKKLKEKGKVKIPANVFLDILKD